MQDWTWLLILLPLVFCCWMMFAMMGKRGRGMRGISPRQMSDEREGSRDEHPPHLPA